MRKLILLSVSLCTLAFFVAASPAYAQTLAWVSANGFDSNSCGAETSPCRTFVQANLNGGTQINCLGSGNYGPMSIAGSIVVDCGDGSVGEITPGVGGFAISIDTTSSATIILRHLSLNGGGANNVSAITTQNFAGGSLIIEHCQIYGFAFQSGIFFQPSGGRSFLQVSDTTVYNNASGIVVEPAANSTASVVLDGVKLNGNNTYGLMFGGAGVVAGTLRQSVLAANGVDGFLSEVAQAYFTVEESSIVDNLSAGIKADSSATNLDVGASTIGGNGTGVKAAAGSIFTFGNNQMSANGANGSFTSTTPLE